MKKHLPILLQAVFTTLASFSTSFAWQCAAPTGIHHRWGPRGETVSASLTTSSSLDATEPKISPSFVPCSISLEPEKVAMSTAWFTNFGMAPPDLPKNAKGAGFGAKKSTKSKAKKKSDTLVYCHRPPDDMVTVLRATTMNSDNNDAAVSDYLTSPEALARLGESARQAIDENLSRNGAVLLRGLPMRTAEAFSHFWKGYLNTEPALEEGHYVSLGGRAGRDKLNGIDLATNVPPQFPLLCHNELCYNPTTVGCIALYCIQDAPLGGETIITRNKDLKIPEEAARFLEEHGGILYSREFYDARNPPPDDSLSKKRQSKKPSHVLGSWQEKCALPMDAEREEADAFFKGMGFRDDQLEWAEEGGLRVTNQHPGYVTDPETKERTVWWNILHTGQLKCADGTPFPKNMVAEIQRRGWQDTYAFKLKPGDWLMLDNLRMQHGRLPYQADPKTKRVLLTVYANPCQSVF